MPPPHPAMEKGWALSRLDQRCRKDDIASNELQTPTLVKYQHGTTDPQFNVLLYFLCLQKGALYLLFVDQEEPNPRHNPLKSSRLLLLLLHQNYE
jgi:hypothetical protein